MMILSQYHIFELDTINIYSAHYKKVLTVFRSPAGMSIAQLSLTGDNFILPGQGEFSSDILAGDGKIDNLTEVFLKFFDSYQNSVQTVKPNAGPRQMPAL